MANVKYADPTYTDIPPTDDDKVMFRTGAGGDARGSIVQPKGYIDGLRLEYVSPTQVRVTSGAAYVPGPKRIAELASAVTLTPSLAANTWYHSYLTVSGSTVGVEAVTTAPAAAYSGTARAKTGDTSRRYIGSFRTDGSGGIIQFQVDTSGLFRYMISNASAPLRVISNGKAATRTTVSLASVLPVSATAFQTQSENTDPSLYVNLSLPTAAVAGMFGIAPGGGKSQIFSFSTAPDQSIDYAFSSAPSGGFYMDVIGFFYAR